MSWWVVDDQLFQNRKFKALMMRGIQGDSDAWGAGLLWVMAGSKIKCALSDGVIDLYDVMSLVPDRAIAERLTAILVEVGLWHAEGHSCSRCAPVAWGMWLVHDYWVYYKESGDQVRAKLALQAERKDQRLKDLVWERDRLPRSGPDDPEIALCAYCQQKVFREEKTGPLRHEVEHVIPEPHGVDNLVIAHQRCNREKGMRTPAQAGMTLHLTDAHIEDLRRRDACSPPGGVAGLLMAFTRAERWPLDVDGVLDGGRAPAGSQTWDPVEGRGFSPPGGVAGSPRVPAAISTAPAVDAGVVCSPPTGVAGPPSNVPLAREASDVGSLTHSTHPVGSAGRASEPGTGVCSVEGCEPATGADRPPMGGISAGEGVREPESGEVGCDHGIPGVECGQEKCAHTQTAFTQVAGGLSVGVEGRAPSRAHARPHARPSAGARVPAGALPGARALAGQGRAGQGQDQGRAGTGSGQGRAGQGQDQGRAGTGSGQGRAGAPGGGKRRKRKRGGAKKMCPEHGDVMPCRLCAAWAAGEVW